MSILGNQIYNNNLEIDLACCEQNGTKTTWGLQNKYGDIFFQKPV
jgi:hypothetical protein